MPDWASSLLSLLRQAGVAAAFVGFGVLIGQVLRRTPLVRIGQQSSQSIYGGVVLLLAVISLVATVGLVVLFTFDIGGSRTQSTGLEFFALIVLIFGGFAIWLGICWLNTRWRWDAEGLEYTEGKRSRRIAWKDIHTLVPLGWSSWRIYDGSNEITWTRLMIGFESINAALRAHRPDLAPNLNAREFYRRQREKNA